MGKVIDTAKDRAVYLVFDEVQVIYKATSNDRVNSPRNKSACVWNLVKSVMSNIENGNSPMTFNNQHLELGNEVVVVINNQMESN